MFKTLPGRIDYPKVEDYFSTPAKDGEYESFDEACNEVDRINQKNYETGRFRMELCNFLNIIRGRKMVITMVDYNPDAKCAFKSCTHKDWIIEKQ